MSGISLLSAFSTMTGIGLSLPPLYDKWQMYNENSVAIEEKDTDVYKEKQRIRKSPHTKGKQ